MHSPSKEFPNKIGLLVRYISVLTVLILSICLSHGQQKPKTYGNEWIEYEQPYVRIAAQEDGLIKIDLSDLPLVFREADPKMLQIWHRGKELSVLQVDSNSIIFYAKTNDGASDSFLFRPESARLNPYLSHYSHEGSYFLTVGKRSGKRSKKISSEQTVNIESSINNVHVKKEIVTFRDLFAFGSYGQAQSDVLIKSYFERGKTWVSKIISGPKATTTSVRDTVFHHQFETKNRVQGSNHKTTLDIAVAGLRSGAHEVYALVGPEKNGPYREVAIIPFTGFDGRKVQVQILDSDFSTSGQLYIKLESRTTSSTDWFGVSHLVLSYPQELIAGNQDVLDITIPAGTSPDYKAIRIKETSTKPYFILEISDHYDTKILSTTKYENTTLVEVPEMEVNGANIVVYSKETPKISSTSIKSIDFKNAPFASSNSFRKPTGELNPSNSDFLIITSDTLKNAALQYAVYRDSEAGGNYNTILLNIRDIYNEFNFGEASPLAIRRFVEYMLQDGLREDLHNLLIIGNSVTYGPNIVAELPNEVPSFGDPGSDILLVAGLNDKNENLAAIPVGRISALNEEAVLSYLEKVKLHESERIGTFWQKEVLHLSGGHSTSEIVQLRNILQNLEPEVTETGFGGKVTAKVKTAGVTTNENVDISAEINGGVGMLTFFGHGSQTTTDLYFGSVKDSNRGYTDTYKFPLMYFNGCGVGNVFSSRRAQGLAGDWLFTPNRGAIALVANSYMSYVSPSAKHLSILYKLLFSDTNSLSIGQIVNKAAETILENSPSIFDISNVHQVGVLGDPSLKLLSFKAPDYILEEDNIKIYAESPDKTLDESNEITVKLVIKNGGRFLMHEGLLLESTSYYDDGSNERRTFTVNPIRYQDTLSFQLEKSEKLLNKIVARINPQGAVPEITLANNSAELIIDWEEAKSKSFFPIQPLRDLIAPRIKVLLDNRVVRNGETVTPNPKISIILEDDRLLPPDPGLVKVYYRICESNDEECGDALIQIPYSNLKLEKQLDDYSLSFFYQPEDMLQGNIELVVTAQDRAGNNLSIPFSLIYAIENEETSPENESSISLIHSPNPATNYVKFHSEAHPNLHIQSIDYFIYSVDGIVQHRDSVINPAPIVDWFFYPNNSMTGFYLYKLIYRKKDGGILSKTGKIIITRD